MSDNVSIPRGVAAEQARRLRMDFCNGGADPCDCSAARAADLLDPPPPLRVEVARAWCAVVYGQFSGSAKNPASDQLDAADAVLAVVRAHYAAEVKALRKWSLFAGNMRADIYGDYLSVSSVAALFTEVES